MNGTFDEKAEIRKWRDPKVAEDDSPAKPSNALGATRKSPPGKHLYARFEDRFASVPDDEGIHMRLYEWSVGEHAHSLAKNPECHPRAPLELKVSGAFS